MYTQPGESVLSYIWLKTSCCNSNHFPLPLAFGRESASCQAMLGACWFFFHPAKNKHQHGWHWFIAFKRLCHSTGPGCKLHSANCQVYLMDGWGQQHTALDTMRASPSQAGQEGSVKPTQTHLAQFYFFLVALGTLNYKGLSMSQSVNSSS